MTAAGGSLVLVVDDDGDVRAAVCEVLEDAEYRTVSAADGQGALDLLRSSAELPSVILLDLIMPRLDGLGFRAEQLRDPRLAGIAVILMTAHASGHTVERAVSASAYLVKPFDLDELLRLLASLC